MEGDFQTLSSYITRKESTEQDKCLHDECAETEEAFVCRKCGLVLDHLYQPNMDWCNDAMMDRQYTHADRLNAIDNSLLIFLEKASCTGSSLPLFVIQERLQTMKITSGYQSLNYAIALICILGEDDEAQKKCSAFLPTSNVAWARSMKMLAPVPTQFVRCWLRNLLNSSPPKNFSKQQQKRFYKNLKPLDETERKFMQDLIKLWNGRVA